MDSSIEKTVDNFKAFEENDTEDSESTEPNVNASSLIPVKNLYGEYLGDPSKGLPEFSLYHPKEGHPDWPLLAKEAKALADEILPKLEAPSEGWTLWRRRLSAQITNLQNYFINRKRDKAGREDLRPMYLLWSVLRDCNFYCEYCDDHRGNKYPDLSNDGMLTTDQAENLLRIMRTGTAACYFAGGEPTMRKDLPTITRKARDLNYYPILINTNGSSLDRLLKNKNWKTWLADTDIIIVSLDSVDLEYTSKIWAYSKPQDVIRNLLLLRELSELMDFKLMVNAVVQPGFVSHARDVLDLANDLDITYCLVPVNIAAEVNGDIGFDPEYIDFKKTILERKKKGYSISGSERMLTRLLNSESLDCRNALKPHVDFDGRLYWPCKATVNVEPELIQVLNYDHVDKLYEAASKKVDPTNFHGPAKNQCGGDCNWAQNYSTDAYVHGLRNWTSLFFDVKDFLNKGGSKNVR